MALKRPEAGWDPLLSRVLTSAGLGAGAPVTRKSMAEWLDRVVSWNARLDLTAARDAESLVDLFVADAAFIAAQAASLAGASWVDVGSGAGAPGLGLALLLPGVQMALVEPKGKRVAFLRSVVGALKTPHISVERRRSQELLAQSYAVAISRATLAPAVWLAEGARIAQKQIWVLLAHAEPPALAGYEPQLDLNYVWPLTGVERRAVCFVRSVET